MIDVVISDNQDITAAGIKYLLQSVKDVRSIQEIGRKSELINYLTIHSDNVLIVLDYMLYDFQSADELLSLSERFPDVRWLLFSDELSSDFLKRLILVSQSFSVVLKSLGIDEINTAFHYAMHGERFICNQTSNQLLNLHQTIKEKQDNLLTTTEKEVLKEIASGKTTKEIATERNLSIHTVITHRKNIFRKLEVNTAYEATKYAMRAGIVDLSEYYI